MVHFTFRRRYAETLICRLASIAQNSPFILQSTLSLYSLCRAQVITLSLLT